jgi:hypothetical protein
MDAVPAGCSEVLYCAENRYVPLYLFDEVVMQSAERYGRSVFGARGILGRTVPLPVPFGPWHTVVGYLSLSLYRYGMPCPPSRSGSLMEAVERGLRSIFPIAALESAGLA